MQRTAIVTGSTSGIGYEAALALAGQNIDVVLAVRDTVRGEVCAKQLRAAHSQARVSVSALDLASLASIRDFAVRTNNSLPRIDILLNNAGLGLQSKRGVTADGFERMFGTNHLGHFALTGLLMPTLLAAPAPRVVTIASIAHKRGQINFDDLQTEHPYSGRVAYGQSKLANLIFALELDRRARLAESRLVSVAAHPGVATTGFMAATGMPGPLVGLGNLVIGLAFNNAVQGAQPGVYAATAPNVVGGQYWGPDGLLEARGKPALAQISPQGLDRETWQRLWTVSEELTGVIYPPLV